MLRFRAAIAFYFSYSIFTITCQSQPLYPDSAARYIYIIFKIVFPAVYVRNKMRDKNGILALTALRCAVYGSSGIGLGTLTRMPSFLKKFFVNSSQSVISNVRE